MEFFAYHGCFREEQVIGTRFTVDLEMELDTAKAEASDRLGETVNYQEVYGVVRREMEIPSHLLEHVGRRILDAVKSAFPEVVHAKIRVAKLNPPIGGKTARVVCVLEH
jgi:dihydroneopterin aldolase